MNGFREKALRMYARTYGQTRLLRSQTTVGRETKNVFSAKNTASISFWPKNAKIPENLIKITKILGIFLGF